MEPLETRACKTPEAWNCLVAFLFVGAGFALLNPAAEARSQGKCSSPMTVAPGDTLSSIARRCGRTVSALISANPHLADPNILPVGFKLTLTQDPQSEGGSQNEFAEGTHVIAVEPTVLTPGGRITVTASNMPPGAQVWIKGGNSRSPKHHLILRGARVDDRGELSARLRLPKWLKAVDGNFTLSVEIPRAGLTLKSDPLKVDARYATGKAR
jgi:LysM repeat protein